MGAEAQLPPPSQAVLYCTVLYCTVGVTLRGQPKEYGHSLEVDDHKEVDFRR